MYRIYDKNKGKWRSDMIILQDGAFCSLKKTAFGHYKMNVMWDEEPYVLHLDTGMFDVDSNVIFEGDICRDKNNNQYVVGYVEQFCAYCIFDYDERVYYVLAEKGSNNLKVIGNVFDGINKDNAEWDEISIEEDEPIEYDNNDEDES